MSEQNIYLKKNISICMISDIWMISDNFLYNYSIMWDSIILNSFAAVFSNY